MIPGAGSVPSEASCGGWVSPDKPRTGRFGICGDCVTLAIFAEIADVEALCLKNCTVLVDNL
jgi:hypothetical protein